MTTYEIYRDDAYIGWSKTREAAAKRAAIASRGRREVRVYRFGERNAFGEAPHCSEHNLSLVYRDGREI
jgi:hypothetical protein